MEVQPESMSEGLLADKKVKQGKKSTSGKGDQFGVMMHVKYKGIKSFV